MTSPVSAIEATNPADRIWAYTNARGSRVWTPMKPVIAGAHEEQEYVLADIHSALARQTEALQRENAEKDKLQKVVNAVLTWAEQRCPCDNDQPNPCPLCGASVENLEPCKSAENTIPRHLLADLRRARTLFKGSENAE